MRGLVFTLLAIDRVVPKFEELHLILGICGGSVIGLLRDVGFVPA